LKSQRKYLSRAIIKSGKTLDFSLSSARKEGLLKKKVFHRKVKYLNTIFETDHGKLQCLIKPPLGFKSMKTAYATLKGFEVMRMFSKGQFIVGNMTKG
jgi:transposase, IS6 family